MKGRLWLKEKFLNEDNLFFLENATKVLTRNENAPTNI
jgi:hypothetical protein